MIRWNKPPIDRHQIALFAPTLDAFLNEDHSVRFVAEVLEQLDFGPWEAEYDLLCGQPPIHPRVMAGAILYGLTLGIRSSRKLEDACGNRLDFIWLLEGRVIDHTTFCKFRTKHRAQLKDLFRQVVLVGQAMGLVQLNQVVWDGTRVKANNSRHHTAREAGLQELVRELDQQVEQMLQEADAQDQHEQSLYGPEGSGKALPAKLAQAQRRLQRMKEAMQTLQQMQEQSSPKRPKAQAAQDTSAVAGAEGLPTASKPKGPQIPLADPDSRVLPNKEGGHAPNYTPVVAMDGQKRFVVDGDVVEGRCEEHAIIPSLERIEQILQKLPEQALADSGFHTAQNLEALEAQEIEALIPAKVSFKDNPAQRADPTLPVPEAQWPQLPVNPSSKVLDKASFVYVEAQDCYYCPMGQRMEFAKEHKYRQGRLERDYRVYQCQACETCPQRKRCIKGEGQVRQIYREQSDAVRQRAAQRLKTPEGQAAYQRRFQVEGVFGIIKAVMGVRQFLLRGMEKVKLEWKWVLTAYNLRLLVSARRALAAGR